MKSVQIKFIKNCPPYEIGETKILRSDDAQELIAIGVAVEMYQAKPAGPKEIKPAGPSEVKVEEFSGKKKVKTPKS